MKVYKAKFAAENYDNDRVIVAAGNQATVLAVDSRGEIYITGCGEFEKLRQNRNVVYVGGISYDNVEELT